MVEYTAIPASVPDDEALPFVLRREPDRSASLDVGGFRVRRGSSGLWVETDHDGVVLAAVLLEGRDSWWVVASVGDVVADLWTLTGVSDADVLAYPVLGAALTGQPLVREVDGVPVTSRVLRPSPATGGRDTVVAASLTGDLQHEWPLGLLLALPVVAVALELLVEYDRLWRTVLAALEEGRGHGDRATDRLEAIGRTADLAKEALELPRTLGTG
jgi:hypothetical protein